RRVPARRPSSGGGQALGDPIEEGGPALLGAVVLLRAHVTALLEQHFGPAVAEVGENDAHELVLIITGPVGAGEHEPLGHRHLAALALPPYLTAAGAGEHRGLPRASRPHVHRDGRRRHLGLGAPEPVSEALGFRPFLPYALARGVEHAGDRDPVLARAA